MAYFALYYIPSADSPFYQLGAQVLGYDVRTGALLPESNATRARLSQFDPAWVARSQEFGFHLTLGDAIEFDAAHTEVIVQEIENVLNCFDPAHPFILHQAPELLLYNDVPRFDHTAVLLRYDANDYLKVFHAVVAAYIHRLGSGSYYTRIPETTLAELSVDQPFRAHRIRHFYSPTPFDSFTPHFTLFNPYPLDADRQQLTADLEAIFGAYQALVVDSVCLLVMPDGAERYELVREFSRRDYPQPFQPR
jgi:hypothetical protein